MKVKKHWCGCETARTKEGVYIKECKLHKLNRKGIWIAFNHD